MVGLLLLFERRDRVAPFLPLAGLVYAGWMLHGEILRWIGPGGAA
jgi:hypothetical protein